MKKFKSARGLKYHMNLHNGIADYQCEDCGKAFVTRQKLMNHRRAKHTFEKPYICKSRQPITFCFYQVYKCSWPSGDACGEGFTRSDWLVVHRRRVHTGEKPYVCDVWDG